MLHILTKSHLPEFSTTSTFPKQGIQVVLHLYKCSFAHPRFRRFLVLQIGQDSPGSQIVLNSYAQGSIL
jgi:hypothetical protein